MLSKGYRFPLRAVFASAIVLLLIALPMLPTGPRGAAAAPVITEFPNMRVINPYGVALGADGNVWFTATVGNSIGQITPAGIVSEYPLPNLASLPQGIAAGPDGALWFTETSGNRIGRIDTTGAITEYPLPNLASGPVGIVAGGDGALWFTEMTGNRIGRITTAGAISEFTITTAASEPYGIAAGSDGNLWFTEAVGNKIGRITTAGVITEFSAGLTGSSLPLDITAGPDGNLWFTEQTGNRIGQITTAGVITEFSAGISIASSLYGIAAGSDGNLWFTESGGSRIGRITPAGVITEFALPRTLSSPQDIIAGPGGQLWFAETGNNRIGRISTSGAISYFALAPLGAPYGMTAGPDGNIWFTEIDANLIGRITPVGVITEFPVPTPASLPIGIGSGPDGALWFTEFGGNKIGRITTAGVITEFSAGITAASGPQSITTGPDGNLWFTEYSGGRIGRITPAGVVTEFAIPLLPIPQGGAPWGIVSGPDGNLWYADQIGFIGKVTTAGVLTTYAVPTLAGSPTDITVGPDGALWFTEFSGGKIGRITTAGSFTEYPLPNLLSGPVGIVAGADGNLWFTEHLSNQIGQITPTGTITEYAVPTPFSGPHNITAGPDGNIWFAERTASNIAMLDFDVPPTVTASFAPTQAKQGDTVTLSITTAPATECVVIAGDHAATLTNAAGQTDWTQAFTAGSGDGTRSVTVTAYPNDDCTGTSGSASPAPSYLLDNTAPVTTHDAPSGWQQSASVTVTLSPTDGGSGVASTNYILDGGGTQSETSVLVSGDGDHTLEFWSTDNVGNTETHQTVHILLDATNPTISASASPAPNGAGWNNSPVVVTFTCGDATSPVTCPPLTTVSTQGANQNVSGTASDGAGNTATASVMVSIDLTPPVTTATPSPALPMSGTYATIPVTVTLSASDPLSGVASTTYAVNGGLQQPYTTPLVFGPDGTYTLQFWSTDLAGNVEAPNTLTFTIATNAITFPAPTSPQTYGAGPLTLGATASSGLDVTYQTSGPCHEEDGELHLDGAGTCIVTAQQIGDSSHNPATPIPHTVVINRAPLTLRANNASIVFGQSYTCAVDPVAPNTFVNNDDMNDLTGTLSCSPSPAVTIGTFPLTPGGLTSPNYAITFQSGTLTVAKCVVDLALQLQPTATLQYSDRLTVLTHVTTCGSAIIPTGSVQYTLAGAVIGSAVFDANGDASSQTILKNAPGTYTVGMSFSSTDIRYTSGTASASLTLGPELATALYTGTPTTFPVNNITKRGTVQLKARITDAGGDPLPGDLRTARVRFAKPDGSAVNPACDNVVVSPVSPGDLTVGDAACSFQSLAATYTVKVVVLGNYTGESSGTTTIIVGNGGSPGGSFPAPGLTGDLQAVRREDA